MMIFTLRKLLLPFCLLCITWVTSAYAAPLNDPLNSFFVTDGHVNAIVRVGGLIYIGGAFTVVRSYTGSGAAINATTGVVDTTFAIVNNDAVKKDGPIRAVQSDGAGGWFIGGDFVNVGGLTRNHIAHILPDKSVDPNWDPNATDIVRALLRVGNILYVGGAFKTSVKTPNSIGGAIRNYIAALDTTTGQATSWDPSADNDVFALAVSGTTIYAGGTFLNIGGQARNRIAALKVSDGSAITTWDANAGPTGSVRVILVSGNTIYAGGGFANIGGQPRNNIAALKVSDGSAITTFDANASGIIHALALSGNTLYVGGGFATIGGSARDHIAAVDATTGSLLAWDPRAQGKSAEVHAVVLAGNTVYLGGDFTCIGGGNMCVGGTLRNRLAAVDATTALPTAWNPQADGLVNSLVLSGSTLYAGGEFDSVGGDTPRNNIAALDATTGVVSSSINPNADKEVFTLTALGNTVFLGGDFTNIAGQTRNSAAAIDAPSGALTSWAPNANGRVSTLVVGNGATTVYAGGDFTNIAGVLRNRIAALTVSTPVSPCGWNPGADNTVSTLAAAPAASGDKIYAAGSFTKIGIDSDPPGSSRSGLAFLKGVGSKCLASPTGLVQSWNPAPNGLVRALLLGPPTICTAPSDPANPTLTTPLYLGGDFTCLDGGATPNCSGGGGFSRNHIAAVKFTGSGAICDWNPGANNSVRALAVAWNTVFAGGDFTNIGLGAPRNRLAALDATSGSATSLISGLPGGSTSWNPNADDSVNALQVGGISPGRLYVGGKFSTLAGSAPTGLPRRNLAAFSFASLVSSILPTSRSVQLGTPATVFAIILNPDAFNPATNVGIASNGFISPSEFAYQALSPISAPVNTPVDIAPNGFESYLITITTTPSDSPLVPTQVPLIFEGTNAPAALQINAVNTWLFSASITLTPDIIALAGTCQTDDGAPAVSIPGSSGASFMVLSTTNQGSGGTITAEANTGSAKLPIKLAICQTNPMTGCCLSGTCDPPSTSTSVTTTIAANEQDTFKAIATGDGTGTVPFDPAVNRIFFNFHDGSTTTGPVRGGTSMAVRTHSPACKP